MIYIRVSLDTVVYAYTTIFDFVNPSFLSSKVIDGYSKDY